MMNEGNRRENGFYWVTLNSIVEGEFALVDVQARVVAEYLNGNWFVTGCQFEAEVGGDISEISDSKITEQQQKKENHDKI